MAHFKVSMELGKKGSLSRVIFVKRDNIIDAMDISKKIRKGKLKTITNISEEEYNKGIDKKYKADPRDGIKYT